jgi:hypothetical protein
MQLDQVSYGVKREAFGPIYLVTWYLVVSAVSANCLTASSFRCHGNLLACKTKQSTVEQLSDVLIEPRVIPLSILARHCFSFWLLVLIFHSAGKLGWPCSLCLLSCDKCSVYSHAHHLRTFYCSASRTEQGKGNRDIGKKFRLKALVNARHVVQMWIARPLPLCSSPQATVTLSITGCSPSHAHIALPMWHF